MLHRLGNISLLSISGKRERAIIIRLEHGECAPSSSYFFPPLLSDEKTKKRLLFSFCVGIEQKQQQPRWWWRSKGAVAANDGGSSSIRPSHWSRRQVAEGAALSHWLQRCPQGTKNEERESLIWTHRSHHEPFNALLHFGKHFFRLRRQLQGALLTPSIIPSLFSQEKTY